MKYFYLIRHGEKKKTQSDPPLSPTGRRQAKLTAKYLSQFPINAIFSSPMKRTVQTAAEIGKFLEIPVSLAPLLRERVNWGDDPNQSFIDFLAMWQQASMHRDWQPPVGDSSLQAGNRLISFLDSLLLHQAEHLVVVTHGGIITDLLRNLFDESYLNTHIADFSSTLDENIKECSITILEKDKLNNNVRLIKLASWEHLKEP